MDKADLIALFGTPTADPPPQRVAVGPLAIDLADGAVIGVVWHGAEVLRGIAYPVRDPNWFTHPDRTLEAHIDRTGDRATYRRSFSTAEGAISGGFTCEIGSAGSLRAHVAFRAERDVTVNRAGFVVLHPIRDEAGAPLTVTHDDGTERQTQLPRLISPGQPVRDIRALSYTVPAAAIRIRFEGDIFEMEDQRNWTDASFKTYCRPLGLPFPYDIPAGTVWEQTITLDLSGGGAAAPEGTASAALTLGPAGPPRLPQVALAHEDGWGALPASPPPGSALVLRADLRRPGAAEAAVATAIAAPVPVELEAVLPDDSSGIAAALDGLSAALSRSGARLQSLTVLPAAYLASHQPEGPWPAGVDPVEAQAEALARLPGLSIGAGVFSNFTELNRLPRRVPDPAFVTYGTTAIVHAADDRSVMQTLEALPQVHASAAALYGGAPIRLGLSAIGMRSNPYGSACAPNPALVRKPGAMDDPRQAGLFAAAFMVGVLAATEGSTVERAVLGALAGPFALLNADGSARPAWHVFRALAALSGAARRAVGCPAGLAGVAATGADGRTSLILANTTPAIRTPVLPSGTGGFVLDHRTAAHCTSPEAALPIADLPATEVLLPPFAILLAQLPAGA